MTEEWIGGLMDSWIVETAEHHHAPTIHQSTNPIIPLSGAYG
jgi:hypothetical protein